MFLRIKHLIDFANKRFINVVLLFGSSLIYICNRLFFQKLARGSLLLFCKCYLNDLLFPLWYLSIANILLITADFELKSFTPVFAVGLLTGLFWEYVAPLLNPKSVSDPVDLMCYLAGTVLYYSIYKMYSRAENEADER